MKNIINSILIGTAVLGLSACSLHDDTELFGEPAAERLLRLCRSCNECVTTVTCNSCLIIIWMDSFSHDFHLFYILIVFL